MADDELSMIEHALTQRIWVPTDEESRLAGALFQRRKRLETEVVEDPAGLPKPTDGRGLFLTQHVSVCSRLARELTEEVLPLWRDRLSGSPMLRLVERYARACEEARPYSERLLATWRTSPPEEPAAELIAREAQRLRMPLDDAEHNTRYWLAAQWEEEQLTKEETKTVDAALHRVGQIGTLLWAAGSGDISY
ncbi:hypothetical protein ABZ419_02550 [Streptomyces cinnamoneus]|uniref:hypothetical protein n=1 Tax=Streptomyces cinnamoneus TaxID=53446 RepID=UPI00340F4B0B